MELNIWDKIKKDNNKSRKSGYIGAIIFNLIFFYIVNNLLNWNISFIADSLSTILWIINLSIAAAILGNLLLLIYDSEWFRHVIKIVMNIFAFTATYFVYKVFPFSFSSALINEIFIIVLILVMVAIVIAAIVELVMLLSLFKRKFKD